MTTGGLTSLDKCQKCPANFFCETPTTREPCPVGTFSSPGAVNKHGCACNNEFDCIYFKKVTQTVSLDLTPEEFEANRAAYIASLAASLGVRPESIKILSIQPAGVGLRRVLKGQRREHVIKITLEIDRITLEGV
jgi:hypothetical protein